MMRTFNTILRAMNTRIEDKTKDRFAVDMLNQKIHDSHAGLKSAKLTLATLIKRQRLEEAQFVAISARINDLSERAEHALADGEENLALAAAGAIADLEDERTAREATKTAISARVERMQLSLERGTRRIADLRQAAITARVVDTERRGQQKIANTIAGSSDITQAEELVERILNQCDPFEEDEILTEIDNRLDGTATQDRLAQAGYGSRTKLTAADIMARLKSNTAK